MGSVAPVEATPNGQSGQNDKETGEKLPRNQSFIQKHVWSGQTLTVEEGTSTEDSSPEGKFLAKHRRLIGLLIPLLFFEICWWSLAFRHNYFQYFSDKYVMSLTMVFGATVAGMTSEGGGAVAFPVMTLVLNITPIIARDFSVMIQSCGMSAAAFTIVWMRLQLEWRSIIFCSTGAVGGLIVGLELVTHHLTPMEKKMAFVAFWFAFAIALFILNCRRKHATVDYIGNFRVWKAVVLLLTGFAGGNFTAIAGSGVDICSFSVLTLLFNVSEKVATPTSVVLMAVNTCVAFYYRELMQDGIADEAWQYLAVCVPIVVIFAPLGSLVSSHLHRHVLAGMIYVVEIVVLVTAFLVLKPPLSLTLVTAGIIAGGLVLFLVLSFFGQRMAEQEKGGTDVEISIPEGNRSADADHVNTAV